MSSHAERTRRGLTLIEVLVAMTIGAIISGVLLGILIDTRRAVLRGQRRVEMATEAATILNHLEATLVAAVPPTSLDDAPTTGTFVFENERCAFVSSRRYDGQSLIVTEIANDPDQHRVLGRTLPLRMTPAAPETDRSGAAAPGGRARALGAGTRRDFGAHIQFRYAREAPAGEDLSPVYRARLEPGAYPKLVRVQLRITDHTEKPPVHYDLVSVYEMP